MSTALTATIQTEELPYLQNYCECYGILYWINRKFNLISIQIGQEWKTIRILK